jgi:beta-galactosidase
MREAEAKSVDLNCSPSHPPRIAMQTSFLRTRWLTTRGLALGMTGLLVLTMPRGAAQPGPVAGAGAGRERLLMDFGWRFAFGHPSDPQKDFGTGTGYFSYLAKAGYGDGAAAPGFDDRAWRMVDVPHDWAVEAPFDSRASPSHGYRAVGRGFPDTSVGWYRKSFRLPASDLGRRISVEFDGVFRDSVVWVNGFYLGREPSGYTGFRYDLTDYLNYGGENVIAVRVDATMEEGWFYEGAGIYRHVWLVKTAPLHVEWNGTFVTTEVRPNFAEVTARVGIINEATNPSIFSIRQSVLDAGGKTVASESSESVELRAGDRADVATVLSVRDPKLWSVETPYLHRLVTTLEQGGAVVDRYETPFGIRTIRFDANEGFFLNGRRVELKGSNNHQDHAGVGAALPDALQEFRLKRLQAMGANAYRSAHNPATPELLDACDRLGVLVIDENRLMGPSPEQLSQLERMIRRGRNHPSVILWSLGNEEWAIEGNIKGARITAAMQAFARRLDPSRRTAVAISGGWGGSSTVIDVAGYNYIRQSNTDRQHARFPNQPGVGTEESTTRQTRGIYFDDPARGHLAPLAEASSGGNAEIGWKHYAARPYLAGLFYWTGFDHRGEPNPFDWPEVGSQCGILDQCGFPKDVFYYLKSWWTGEPLVHVFPHWNWPGKEGQTIRVTVNSNCEEVELLLNQRSLGRKRMEKNSHLEWEVNYEPGTLWARGFNNGQAITSNRVETTSAPAAIALIPDRARIKADGEDVAVVAVQVNDAQGRLMPLASNPITFSLQGPGRIIGVGNGDPASHEPDRFIEQVNLIPARQWRRLEVNGLENRPEVAPGFDDSQWPVAFDGSSRVDGAVWGQTNVFRGVFEVPPDVNGIVSILLQDPGERHWVYLNGRLVGGAVHQNERGHEFKVETGALRPGRNIVAILATPRAERGRDQGGRVRSGPAMIKLIVPPGDWKRSAFNGLAQVIVQSTGQPGQITLRASSPGLSPGSVQLEMQTATSRPSVPAVESIP